MSHQVLARKWRPARFADLIGQPHVVRALSNALASGRLHHAYLFAGTRGVGKTTIARILARCLNCEEGVSAEPCGRCRCCTEIAEGRHLDLLEVDAASRTRVDDTRELLDNVSYAPVSGRYKVYLIDEVHMLSEKSFNALLKTLEEPPDHVVFLLATTDPQKLPVTVLSRCLQFNLKPMPATLIAEHLARVLEAEGIAAEPGALLRLGEAAEGSVRDALSLADQAIAYGGDRLTEAEVCEMIGLLPRARLTELLDAAWAGDGAQMLAVLQELEALAPDWARLLEALAALVHEVAIAQVLGPDGAGGDGVEAGDALAGWRDAAARSQAPEDVQLAYEILVHGARDLPHAPDPRIGVQMALLRLLAFRPLQGTDTTPESRSTPQAAAPPRRPEPAARGSTPAPEPRASQARATPPPAAQRPPAPAARAVPPTADPPQDVRPSAPPVHAVPPAPQPAARPADAALDWHAFAAALSAGPTRELALHAELRRVGEGRVVIAVPPAQRMLATERARGRLAEALERFLGTPVRLEIEALAVAAEDTPAARLAADAAARQASAEERLRADPAVRALQEVLGASVARVTLADDAPGDESPARHSHSG
jgi:DNA polymerase III subunit gamma/tau